MWAARFHSGFKGLLILLVCGLLPLEAADRKTYIPGRLLVGPSRSADPDLRDRVLRLHGAIVRRHLPELGVSIVDVPEEQSQAVLSALENTGLFAYVERDGCAHTAAVPNDPAYASQWHLPKIQGPQAWSLTTGAASVVVAIIDSGVYGTHPDLAPKLVAGWNFVKGNADTSDVLGHGTAVAGTVSAASNNNIGVAGVSWASKLMPLVVVNEEDFAAYSNIAAAIQYAVDHGVRVLNISVGGPTSSITLQNAVDYAWNKGALIFASAMNDGSSTPNYPAACSRAVAVSASDSNDHLAAFSNYGNWISLAAPGTNILTTNNGGGYGYWFGTSFASPIAAGVAALCLAVNPNLTNAALRSILEQTADDIGDPGRDLSFGWGRVNAYRAVSAVRPATLSAPSPPPLPPSIPPLLPQSPRRYPSGASRGAPRN